MVGMNKIKVAFFAEILISDYDGASRTMFQIINRIPKEYFEFHFFCAEGPDKINGFDCTTLPSVTIPFNANYKMALPLLAQTRLKEKLAEFNPDVIHISTPSLLGKFALKYGNRHHIPVITIYHTHFISYVDYYLRNTPFLINYVKGKVIESSRNFYNHCEVMYVPSESIADELNSIGIDRSKMKIWKRGIDRKLFNPQKKDLAYMHGLTGNNRLNILFASRLVWEKNLETLIKVYDEFQQRKLPYNIVIAGDGVAQAECETRMPNAVFLGNVNHETLSVLYASCDVFLFPSVSETIGNVILEAMASGLPCVIADGGGSRDFIEQGINGFKCSPYNAVDYTDKIVRILENETLKNSFIQEGIRHSRSYNWKTLTDIYFEEVSEMAHMMEYA